MRRATLAASAALITLGAIGSLADRSLALPLSDPRVHDLAIAGSPIQKHGVAAGGNGTELVGSEAVGPLVMIRAGTRVAAPPQRGTTRIGALGEGRPPIGIGSTDRPRLLLRGELGGPSIRPPRHTLALPGSGTSPITGR